MADRDDMEAMVKRLVLAHSAWYDFIDDYEFGGMTFNAYGEFHSIGEQFVLVKRAKIWEINNHDHMFISTVDHLTEPDVTRFVDFMTKEAIVKAQPRPNQMSCNLTLILVCGDMDDEAARRVRKSRFRKNFKFGLEGWADLRLAAIDISGKRVVTNGAAREMRKTLAANARIG